MDGWDEQKKRKRQLKATKLEWSLFKILWRDIIFAPLSTFRCQSLTESNVMVTNKMVSELWPEGNQEFDDIIICFKNMFSTTSTFQQICRCGKITNVHRWRQILAAKFGKYIWERKIKVYCTFSGLQTIWKTWTLKKQTKEWITCINCKNTLKFKFSGSILLIIATVV